MIEIHVADFLIGPNQRIIERGAVVFSRSRILHVGPFEETLQRFGEAKVTDHGHAVLSPGFVNAHMHMYGVLAHGLASPVPITSFESFLNDYWWPLVENQLDGKMIGAASEHAALESIDSGVTTLCDVLEAPLAAQEGLSVAAHVLASIGLRSVLSVECSERLGTSEGLDCLQANLSFAQRMRQRPEGVVSSMLCLHTAFTCSAPFIRQAIDLADAHGIDIQLHLNESDYEPQWVLAQHGERTVQWYDRLGLLSDRLVAAQCVRLDPSEIGLLAKHKVRAVHVPISNCEVGGGISPVPDMLEAGIPVGLGTDGYINNFFELMRWAFLVHKGHRRSTQVMPAHTVWNMATQMGAQVVFGVAGCPVGLLAPDCWADFQVISLDSLPTFVHPDNLFEQLVLYRNPSDVREVYIAGRQVKHAGRLLGGDLAKAREATRMEANRLRVRGVEAARVIRGERGKPQDATE